MRDVDSSNSTHEENQREESTLLTKEKQKTYDKNS